MIVPTMKTDAIASLDDLSAFLAERSARPGWDRASTVPTSSAAFLPAHWKYAEMRPAMDAAGRLVDTEFAERRNFILVNPVDSALLGTSPTLVAAYQMILPGERARSHRHTANALRFILDTHPGISTIVNGVPYPMLPGDVLLTPNWHWHGHANDSGAPGYWIDVLDAPLTVSLGAMKFEPYPEGYESPGNGTIDSAFIYRWSETKAALAAAPAADDALFVREIALDRYDFKTIALSMGSLEAGCPTSTLLTTATNLYCVAEGQGRSRVGELTFAWKRGDVFVAPGGVPHHHETQDGAVLFRVTDAPLLAAVDWLH